MNTLLSPKQVDTLRMVEVGAITIRNAPPAYMLGLMHRKLTQLNDTLRVYELTLKGRLVLSLYQAVPSLQRGKDESSIEKSIPRRPGDSAPQHPSGSR
jgi:hypothetical protein